MKGIWAALIAVAFLAGTLATANLATANPSNAANSNGIVGALSSMVFELKEQVAQLQGQANPPLEPINPLLADVPFTPIAKFTLDIGTSGEDPASNWYSVSGGSQILHSSEQTKGSDQFVLDDSGDVEFAKVKIVGPFVSGGSRAELLSWINDWTDGNGETKTATLKLLQPETEDPSRTINYFDAIPCDYNPPSVRAGDDSLLEESFTFKPSRVEVVESSSDNDVPAARQIQRQGGAELEEVITGRAFKFEIDGQQIPSIATVEPGSFRCELKDATMGNRQGNFKDFTVTKPQFETWRVEKYYSQGDLHLKELFDAFATGEKKSDPQNQITLTYLGSDNSESLRTIDCFGYVPLHYESVSLDSRNPGQAATEVMEFSVTRCEYE